MNSIFSKSALLVGMLTLAGCSDIEPTTPKEEAVDPNAISFSLGQDEPVSRTQYAPNHWRRIEWQMCDEVFIWCKQAQQATPGKGEPYQVIELVESTDIVDGHEIKINSKAKIAPESTGLYWGKDVEHIFYAGYGENIIIDNKGLATCEYNPEQVLTKGANGAWTNMKQAYMVAYKATTQTGNVVLHFKPIMTTLDIDVLGPEAGSVDIKAIEITVPAEQDVVYTYQNKAYFNYQITGLDAETGETTGNVITDNVGTKTAEKFIFTLDKPQTVNSGDFIRITAILPPIAIGDGNTEDYGNPITLTVDATNGSNKVTINANIAKVSEKAVIKTNKWVAPKQPDYVDLGLGVKWATCNLGASSAEELGDYFGWGCAMPYATSANVGDGYSTGDWSLYFQKLGGSGSKRDDCGKDGDPLKEFVYPNTGKSISGGNWDAAHVRLGGNWRMPTQQEINNLTSNCVWEKSEQNGVKGYKVMKKKEDGKGDTSTFIFIPYSVYRSGTSIEDCEEYIIFWSPTSDDSTNKKAYNTKYYNGYMWDLFSRNFGLPIRPVLDDSNVASNSDIDRQGSSGSSKAGDWE